MGASSFCDFVRKSDHVRTAEQAFAHAVDEARHECGHGGYTGTIAEKTRGFVMITTAPTIKEGRRAAEHLLEGEDERIDDKWGPAGCITVDGDEPGWFFVGWASC